MSTIKEFDKLIDTVKGIYKSLPPLPKGLVEFIVAITPWLALVFGVLGVLASLTALGLGAFFAPLMALGGGVQQAAGITIAVIIGAAEAVIILIAFPSLMSRKIMGWKLLFLSEILAIISAIITMSPMGVVWGLVWLYVLFQMEPFYKAK